MSNTLIPPLAGDDSSMHTNQPQQATVSLQQQIQALEAQLPGLVSAINQQQVPAATGALNAAQATLPGYAQLLSQITSGAGGDMVNAISGMDKSLNPEYYANRTLTGNALSSLINSYGANGNLAGLSPAETAVAERSINQDAAKTGNLNQNNALKTVTNAMAYGTAFDQKRAALNSALGTANTFAGTATRLNPSDIINTGIGSHIGTFSTDQANQTANTVLGSASTAQNTFNQGVAAQPSNFEQASKAVDAY